MRAPFALAALALAGCSLSLDPDAVPLASPAGAAAGAAPEISSFAAYPPTVVAGGTSMLRWSVSDGSVVSISPGVGAPSAAGHEPVAPTATTIYTLTATNAHGSTSATATVAVTPGIRDQAYAPTTFNAGLGVRDTTYYRSQSFTVGRSGALSAVELLLNVCTVTTATVEIAIRAAGSAASSAPLASGTISAGAVVYDGGCGAGTGPSAHLAHAVLTPALAVTAGQSYVIWARSSNQTDEYGWWGDSPGAYAGGEASVSGRDMGFATYVVP